MSEPTVAAYEQEIRALAPYPSDAPWKLDVVPFLLRLLDAERARADAAESAATDSMYEADKWSNRYSSEKRRADLLEEQLRGPSASV